MTSIATRASILFSEFDVAKVIEWIKSNAMLVGIAVGAIIVLIILKRLLSGGKKQPAPEPVQPSLTVAELGGGGVPTTGPKIIFRKVPVRLAALVIAPMGRTGPIPPVSELPGMVDRMLPGLASIVAAHRPAVQGWRPQSSAAGFASSFFGQAKLPGKLIGIGTEWTAVAGTYRHEGARFAIGLILRADAPNNLGQIVIDDEAEWQTNFVVG